MRDYLQRAAIRAPNRIRVKKKTPPEGKVGKFMERATGLEPANTSLGIPVFRVFHCNLAFIAKQEHQVKGMISKSTGNMGCLK